MAIVHDNTPNIVGAAKSMIFESISCFAHTLQLTIHAVFEHSDIKAVIKKCTVLMGYLKHSNIASNALKSKQVQLNVQQHKLIQAVGMRWNSMYHMIKRLVEQREAIVRVLSDRAVTTRAQAKVWLMTEEWATLETILPMR